MQDLPNIGATVKQIRPDLAKCLVSMAMWCPNAFAHGFVDPAFEVLNEFHVNALVMTQQRLSSFASHWHDIKSIDPAPTLRTGTIPPENLYLLP